MIKAIPFLMLFVFANCGRAAVIAQYDFDGNTDDSIRGAGYAGVVTGTTSYTANNKAFHFDGSTYIKAASAIGGLSAATVSSWVKFDSLQDWSTIVKDDWNAYGPIHFGLSGTGENPDIQVWAANSYPPTYGGATSPTAIQTGTWYNIAFTYNSFDLSPSLNLYVNGDLVASSSIPVAPLRTSTYGFMSFGDKLDPSGNPINGQNLSGDMDGLGFFNTALSGNEIKAIYNAGVGAVPEPSTISMLAIGLAGFALYRRHRN